MLGGGRCGGVNHGAGRFADIAARRLALRAWRGNINTATARWITNCNRRWHGPVTAGEERIPGDNMACSGDLLYITPAVSLLLRKQLRSSAAEGVAGTDENAYATDGTALLYLRAGMLRRRGDEPALSAIKARAFSRGGRRPFTAAGGETSRHINNSICCAGFLPRCLRACALLPRFTCARQAARQPAVKQHRETERAATCAAGLAERNSYAVRRSVCGSLGGTRCVGTAWHRGVGAPQALLPAGSCRGRLEGGRGRDCLLQLPALVAGTFAARRFHAPHAAIAVSSSCLLSESEKTEG